MFAVMFCRAGILATAAALALTAAGCAKSGGSTTASGVKLVNPGQLTTCTSLPYAPFQFKEASGKVVGFDVDMVDLVAKKLKVSQKIVDTPFNGIKSGQDLKTGKCDIAAAGMSITPERQQAMDFSAPYFDVTQAMLVKEGAPYKTLADLKNKRVGAQAGTTGLDYVRRNAAQGGYEVVDYPDLGAEYQALATGQVDAAVNDLPVWNDYLKKSPGKFVIAAQFNTGEKYGFALKKGGNPELLKMVNDTIAQARKDGTYAKLHLKWMGTAPRQ